MTSLVLPVFNAARTVGASGQAVRQFLRSHRDWEAIFVCDGCSDDSESILRDVTAGEPRMQVLAYQPNRGKGHAVRHGLLAARGDYRLFTDCDLAYSFDDILSVAEALHAGADLALASREHPESLITLPPRYLNYAYRRRWQSHVFGCVARWLLPLAQRDTQAGLKGMTARAAEWLLPHAECDGFGFDCELLMMSNVHGLIISEVPVTMRLVDTASTTGGRAMLQMLRDLWRIRQRWTTQHIPAPITSTILKAA